MTRGDDVAPGTGDGTTSSAAAEPGTVLVDQVAGLRTLTLSRPGRRNAMDSPMLEALADGLRAAARDRSVRAVLLTGDSGTFSSGGDVEALAGPDQAATVDLWTHLSADIAHTIFHAEKPVVAGVDGPAYGAGFALAIACDVVLLTERAQLGPVFVRRGILPDHGALWFLPRLIGLLAAKELIFSGRTVDAEEARRLGLCTRVLPVGGFAEAARAAAMELAEGPTLALGAAKLIMNKGLEGDLWTVQAFERVVQPSLFASRDADEAFRAWTERRSPRFVGG